MIKLMSSGTPMFGSYSPIGENFLRNRYFRRSNRCIVNMVNYQMIRYLVSSPVNCSNLIHYRYLFVSFPCRAPPCSSEERPARRRYYQFSFICDLSNRTERILLTHLFFYLQLGPISGQTLRANLRSKKSIKPNLFSKVKNIILQGETQFPAGIIEQSYENPTMLD